MKARGVNTTTVQGTIWTPVAMYGTPTITVQSGSAIKYDASVPTGTPAFSVVSSAANAVKVVAANLTGVTDNGMYWCNLTNAVLVSSL